MIGHILPAFIIIGFMLVGHGIPFEELKISMDNVEQILEEKEFEASNIYLSAGLENILRGYGQVGVGFVYIGGWIYQMFTVPEEFVDPIGIFFIIDMILLGTLTYISIYLGMKLFFAGFLLLIEKIGLINWGGRE